MNTRRKSAREWSRVRAGLEQRGPGATATILKSMFPHPLDAGARRTTTWPVGQAADYAIPGPSGTPPVVVQEYEDRFVAAIEGVELATRAAHAAEQNPSAAEVHRVGEQPPRERARRRGPGTALRSGAGGGPRRRPTPPLEIDARGTPSRPRHPDDRPSPTNTGTRSCST